MNTIVRIRCIEDIQFLQELAVKMDEEIGLSSMEGDINVDVKTFIGLFSLDFNEPVRVVSESEKVHKKVKKYFKERVIR